MPNISPTAIVLASFLFSSSAFAATTVNYYDANSVTGSSTEGTVTTESVATDGDKNRVITYTIVDIDFDGDGAADTLEVTITASSTNTITTRPNGALGVNSSSDKKSSIDAAGESITYSYTSASVELTSGAPAPEVTFGGFTELNFDSYGKRARHLLDGLEGNANDTGDAVSLNSVDSFEVGYGPNSRAGFYVGELDFSVIVSTVAVPEPTSTALLGLGLSTLILRRRRV